MHGVLILSLKNKRVLLTYGPTWVAIDSVRVLSNVSTGQMGKTLARLLKKEGARVTALEGPVQAPLKDKGIKIIPFRFFGELQKILATETQKNYDIIIHAAAVSDYRPRHAHAGKLNPDSKKFTIDLIPTPKIINHLKKICPRVFLVGFKLGGTATKLFKEADCDLVVANQLENKKYSGYILDRQKNVLAKAHSRAEMAQKLINVIKQTTI